MEENIKKWKDILCLWIGRVNIVNKYLQDITSQNGRMHIFSKYTWNVLQDRTHARPQNKSHQMYRDRNYIKHFFRPQHYDTLHTIRTNHPKIYMEPQKTLNCQSKLDEKEQGWRYHVL